MKQDEDDIYASLDFEHFLSYLFGKRPYHGFVGSHSLTSWKREMVKLVRVLRRAVRINVDTDVYHRNDLIWRCDNAIERLQKSKNLDEVNTTFIKFSVTLNFMLLGHFPSHWDKDNTSHPSLWKLDEFRKLIYSQNDDQKVKVILNLPDKYGYREKLPESQELTDKYFREFKGNSEQFLQWFKSNFAEVYADIS